MESSMKQDKYKDSFMFSTLVNKIFIGVGADRGGGDVINTLCLLNQIDGNCAQYSIPIEVVERTAEDCDVLKKTIYKESARELL